MVRSALHGDYPAFEELQQRWRELTAQLGGRESQVGRSVDGRPLWCFELGSRAPQAPTILLTALIHGSELIGSIALFDALQTLGRTGGPVLEEARLAVMPIVNPDALANNMDRLARGRIAFQRRNARKVDLNRNFPGVGQARSWHPFSGSSWRWSPYHRGPHALSEPESRAVAEVATRLRPRLALGFHSFGNLILFPWAHCRIPNPRQPAYQRLAHAFVSGTTAQPYRFRQANDFYPTIGDLDDWLDASFGTLALTIEVGALDRRLLDPRRFINPFCWMNPSAIGPTAANTAPGVIGLMRSSLVPA
jgi:predicted deacylase